MGVERHDVNPDDPHDKRCVSYGIGSSKKEGEQNAAKMALVIYGILKQDQYSQSDIYYPPWDKIANFDGENMIIKINDNNDTELELEAEQTQNNDSSEIDKNFNEHNKKEKKNSKTTKTLKTKEINYDSDVSIYSEKSI
jgi:hypothetical protein